jgi:hypothetical protein
MQDDDQRIVAGADFDRALAQQARRVALGEGKLDEPLGGHEDQERKRCGHGHASRS